MLYLIIGLLLGSVNTFILMCILFAGREKEND